MPHSNSVWFYWYKAYFLAAKKRNFGLVCANIYITLFLFDNKVLKGFSAVNITFMHISEPAVFDLNSLVSCVCIRNAFVSSSKETPEVLCVSHTLVANSSHCSIPLFKIALFRLWGVNNLKVNVICVSVVIHVAVTPGYVSEVVLSVWHFRDDTSSWQFPFKLRSYIQTN